MDIKVTDVRCQKGDAAFLIDDGKTSILYDTGFGFTGYAVADNIKKCLGERELDYCGNAGGLLYSERARGRIVKFKFV